MKEAKMHRVSNVAMYIIIAAALCLSANHSGYGQIFSQGDVTYFNLPEVIQKTKRSCLSIETIRVKDEISKVEPTKLGSGFLTLKTGNRFAITNYHVIKAIRPDDRLLVGLNLKQGKIYSISSVVSVDINRDIAVLAIADSFLSKNTIDTAKFYLDQAAIGISAFADSNDFLEGTGVLLIGFPLGLGTEVAGNQPVSRIGLIAQSVRPNGNFLIDGIASHGNSGSPVFSTRSGKLVGIVIGFPSDYISAFDENGQLVARLPYNSGLSVCISSKEIWKLIP
jgi:S1-C subfamily serine protease